MTLHYEVEWELDDEFIDDIVEEVEEVISQYPDSNIDDCISEITEDNLCETDLEDCDHFNMENYIDDVVEEVKHRYYDRKQKSTTILPMPPIPTEELHSGYIQRMDDLGRICIPKSIRTRLNLEDSYPFEIFFDNQGDIILKKYHS